MREYVGTVAMRNKTIKFVKQLERLAKRADELNLTLPNGGIVGSLLGSMANDLTPALLVNHCGDCLRLGGVIVYGCEISGHKAVTS